jgi:hypothetical protein
VGAVPICLQATNPAGTDSYAFTVQVSGRSPTVVVAALAVVLSPGCSTSSSPSQAGGSASTSPAPQAASPSPASGTGIRTRPAEVPTSSPAAASPARLVVASARIDIAVRPVGVAPDEQMELPPDPAVIGRYRFGSAPGDPRGAVVLGGHLDSKRYGVGPLVRLRKLGPGDELTVRMSDGKVAQYRVTKVEEIAKRRLPIDQIFDRDGPPALRIVTCGGPYDERNGGYRDNLVVSAAPAGTSTGGGENG